MQVTTLPFAALVLSLASSVFADAHHGSLRSAHRRASQLVKRGTTFTPTAPGPGDVFKVGTPIPIQWDPDTSGSKKWKQTTIRFMTGSNLNMTELEVVGVVDGTDPSKTTLSWPAPQVNPYSAIYFLQFDHGGDEQKDPTWTTRFAIADASGATVAPPHAHQPENTDNPPIPYGDGVLLSAASSGSGGASSSGDNDNSTSVTSTPTAAATSTASSTTTTTTSTSTSAPNATTSTTQNSSTGAAAPKFLAQPAGMALVGGAIGLAAVFVLIFVARACMRRRHRQQRDEHLLGEEKAAETVPTMGYTQAPSSRYRDPRKADPFIAYKA